MRPFKLNPGNTLNLGNLHENSAFIMHSVHVTSIDTVPSAVNVVKCHIIYLMERILTPYLYISLLGLERDSCPNCMRYGETEIMEEAEKTCIMNIGCSA
jgi:hypothetical protein